MTWNLRREEVLDGDQLRAMLEDSPASAARAILIAAQANIVDAQALLGQILLDGSGIECDPALALVWFQIAARRGHAMAQNMAGRCHEHGWGCEPDAAKAAEHYRLAAEDGLVDDLVAVLRVDMGIEYVQRLDIHQRADLAEAVAAALFQVDALSPGLLPQ